MQAVPQELMVEVFTFCSVKDIVASFSMVSQTWLLNSNNLQLWHILAQRDLGSYAMEGMGSEEFLGEAITQMEELYPNSHAKMNYWKKIYIWTRCHSIPFRWAPPESEELRLYDKGLKVCHSGDSSHEDIYADRSFGKGIHRWGIEVNGIDPMDGYWILVGILLSHPLKLDAESTRGFTEYWRRWGYGSRCHSGWGSVGKVHGPDAKRYKKIQACRAEWRSKDRLACELNFNTHIFKIVRNGEVSVELTLPDEPVWPWANIFERNTSATLIPYHEALKPPTVDKK